MLTIRRGSLGGAPRPWCGGPNADKIQMLVDQHRN
jgi:hypothetical protein